MKLINKYGVIQEYKLDGDFSQLELLRISFKSGGANCYLPHDVVRFLNLNKSTRALVGFLDDSGATNFLIITSDKNLSEMLKPLILRRRQRAEQMRQQLKVRLQSQRQQTGTEVVEVMH